MGLQNQLSDVSSESILVLMVVLIGRSVSYLHSLLLTILHALGLRFEADRNHHLLTSLNDVVGSGLANLIVLCDQLNLNRACSYPIHSDGAEDLDANCVVCFSRFAQGDHVRRLACRHVFHKDCFERWLDHLNFNCPLCRASLQSDDQLDCAQRRVAGDLLAWFTPQS